MVGKVFMTLVCKDMDPAQPLVGFVKLCRIASTLRDELVLAHQLIISESSLAEHLITHFEEFRSFGKHFDIWTLSGWIELVDKYKTWLNEVEKRLQWLEHVRIAKSTVERVLNVHSDDDQLNSQLQTLRTRWGWVSCVELFLREVCCFYDRNKEPHCMKPIRLWNVSLGCCIMNNSIRFTEKN